MKRHQRTRAKGYRTPENTKYIGRPTKLGNPFRLTKDNHIEAFSPIHKCWIIFKYDKQYSVEYVVDLYEFWLKGHLQLKYPYVPKPPTKEEIEKYRNYDLSCFCPLHQPCHVDVVLKYLENE